jgi:hypothetical protein
MTDRLGGQAITADAAAATELAVFAAAPRLWFPHGQRPVSRPALPRQYVDLAP